MKHLRWKRTFAGAAALLAGSAMAADALVPIEVPAEFRFKPTGVTEAVMYTEALTEHPYIDIKKIAEGQCALMRKMGITTHTPVFEAGYDEPSTTFSRRINSALASATLSTLRTYSCDAVGRIKDICACTYRMLEVQNVHISKVVLGQREHIDARVTERTATRYRTKAAPPTGAEVGIEWVKKLAPTVIGSDVVAGMPCVLRRQDLTKGAWIERCIFEDLRKEWPPEMRFQALSETDHYVDKGVEKIGDKTRTVSVVRNAAIDSGVFNMPEGMKVKESK